MSDKMFCSTCKKEITNQIGSTRFKCPKCSKIDLIRCAHCRELGTRYTCGGCSFSGPN